MPERDPCLPADLNEPGCIEKTRQIDDLACHGARSPHACVTEIVSTRTVDPEDRAHTCTLPNIPVNRALIGATHRPAFIGDLLCPLVKVRQSNKDSVFSSVASSFLAFQRMGEAGHLSYPQ